VAEQEIGKPGGAAAAVAAAKAAAVVAKQDTRNEESDSEADLSEADSEPSGDTSDSGSTSGTSGDASGGTSGTASDSQAAATRRTNFPASRHAKKLLATQKPRKEAESLALGEVRARAKQARTRKGGNVAQRIVTLLTYARLTRPPPPPPPPSGWRLVREKWSNILGMRQVAEVERRTPEDTGQPTPARVQPQRNRYQPSNFVAGAAPPPAVAHAQARAAVSGRQVSAARVAVGNYSLTRTRQARGVTGGIAKVGAKRREKTTRVARHGMELQWWMGVAARVAKAKRVRRARDG